MTALLSIIAGSFDYGDKSVFSNINLSIHKDEVLCILGSNGCGKTTLLRCLSGSLSLKQGTVQLGDRKLSGIPISSLARKIGFVFQEHAAPFPFSVFEVVQMGRAPHLKLFATPSARDKEIAREQLELVGMYHLRDKPYTQISGGERQLVLIARTLAQEPEIILMDEPTSHLDFRNQTIVLQIVNKLARQGMAILMTSHLPDHAMLFSSRVALMKDGNFTDVGNPARVMTESSLMDIYGIKVNIIETTDPNSGDPLKLVVPQRISDIVSS